jgi:flagellar motility protein MotE (MotC chaperone)
LKVLFRRLRLLPLVIVLGTGLLVVKGSGLIMAARAQDAAAAAPAPAASAPQAAAPDPATADDTETATTGQVDVLSSLSKRSAELDARAQDLTMQENLIVAAEKRVDDKIAQLKALQTQMQTLLGQRDTAQQAQITALVKTYSSMKPKDAARIFDNLDDDVLLAVAQAMKPDVLGAVLAAMQPDNAQKLTVKLADRLKPPPPPAQLAALTPPATMPTATAAAAPATAPQTAAPTPAANAPATASQQTAANTAPPAVAK